MGNFFTDNPDLVETFERLDLSEIVDILERGYLDPEGPTSYPDAMENYRLALGLAGEIAADTIAPASMSIDQDGARLTDGAVVYAPGSEAGYRRLGESGLTGTLIPRRFGGLGFPATVYIMMIEMVSRADASMMTMFGYQDIGEAIAEFASEEVADKYLPDYASGRHVGAMVMTEPGAGSDLQAIRLRAYQDDDGQWRLRGVKQFISNGNGQMLLVLARSEPDVEGMFGLSLFACHGGDRVQVTRLEEKMGLHGSPTCELYFDDAPVDLVGKRRHGLIHVLHILNHARFSVAAQGLGIAEAAYRQARDYAGEREQFGTLIGEMPPVADLLVGMRVDLDAGRAMLYDGTVRLDLRNRLEERIKHVKGEGGDTSELKARFKKLAAQVDLLSPAVKYWITEAGNRICYDALQVHGGMGYMKELPLERMARDIRITTIYEGTTQVQVGAALGHVLSDVLAELFDEWAAMERTPATSDLAGRLGDLRKRCSQLIETALAADEVARRAGARWLTDAYLGVYGSYLLLNQAETDERKRAVAQRFIAQTAVAIEAAAAAFGEGLHTSAADPTIIIG
jgi:alkylation response protein AidB-like acyl-CoA dehydrogenase